MNIRFMLTKLLVPEFFERYKSYQDIIHSQSKELSILSLERDSLQTEVDTLTKEKKALEANSEGLTELEQYCQDNFEEIPLIAYTDKFTTDDGTVVPVTPNEFITPYAHVIKQTRAALNPSKWNTSLLSWAKVIAKGVDQRLQWTSDEKRYGFADRYELPAVGLMQKKIDCEGHAHIVSSIEPQIGVAFGKAGTTAHAWNVFVYKDELYCLETNTERDRNNSHKVFKYADQSKYVIYQIFTQYHTYRVKRSNIRFGVKAK